MQARNWAEGLSRSLHGHPSRPSAGLYKTQGHYAEAEPLYQRSLAIREKAFGPEHPHVATSLANYAALLRQTARADEVQRMAAHAKAIRGKSE